MKQVAKLVIIDGNGKYLLMYRSAHPRFGEDPDLPGGTVEDGESSMIGMIREVEEEAGIAIAESEVEKIYEGTDFSENNTDYALYVTKLTDRPKVVMSWEHSTYEWLGRDEFLAKSKSANDTYMHMVYDKLK